MTKKPSRAARPGQTAPGTSATEVPKPELLAPAGQIESFFAALENGADAIYLGLKRLSARATATNFTLDELAQLVPYAHTRKVAIYVALNSVLTAPEFPGILDMLKSIAEIGPDALIVQDPGIISLARKCFPELALHASTLATVHNHAGVNQLQRMGLERVVLARELRLEEIDDIASRTTAGLEVFVHGALCYSYSGLCLTSSYRGGHSGLQGRCVQPCRLQFRQGKKEGFFLSCNDLCALPVLSRLKKMRIAAFKLEGRMKPADYIARVVKAYRLVLDAPSQKEEEAVEQAREWLAQSPSRRLTTGFLGADFQSEILSPHRSGSSGLWIGTVKKVERGRILVSLRRDIRQGDRLRPETREAAEKSAFTVSEIRSEAGVAKEQGNAGDTVLLQFPGRVVPGDRLFKVGTKTKAASGLWQKLRGAAPSGHPPSSPFPGKEEILREWPSFASDTRRSEESVVLKAGSWAAMPAAFRSTAQRVVLVATRQNLEQVAKQRLSPAQKNRFMWSLPALMMEKEIEYYRAAVNWYADKGFLAWEMNNWAHFDLFARGRSNLALAAGTRFNIRNAAAVAAMADAGCQWTILSLEITREELAHLGRTPLNSIPVVPVYAWPPLFTSRLLPRLSEDKAFTTPRNDMYLLRKRSGHSVIYADRPMNWFKQLSVLREMGYRNFLIDLSEGPEDLGKEVDNLLNHFRSSRAEEPYSLFNFERQP